MKKSKLLTCLFLALAFTATATAGSSDLKDKLNSKLNGLLGNDASSEQDFQSEGGSQVVDGLKEALAKGVDIAVTTLGKDNGFLGDELVKISIPDSLNSVTKIAKKLGGKKYIDQFVTTMNHAAEQATPKAAEILSDAIRNMSIEDALGILKGSDDAATQYFRKNSEQKLKQSFLPVVEQATEQSGATKAYKKLLSKGGGKASGMLGGALGGVVDEDDLDLDQYVTEKALDGLFTYIAIEEKKIRSDPLARTTDLLKKVFGKN
ncbi:MAG: DUF4197 domain-containing protein [bacterium]